jgi:hypothetical protein
MCCMKLRGGAAIVDACLPDLHLFGQPLLMTDAHWLPVFVASKVTWNKRPNLLGRGSCARVKRLAEEVRDWQPWIEELCVE